MAELDLYAQIKNDPQRLRDLKKNVMLLLQKLMDDPLTAPGLKKKLAQIRAQIEIIF